ncbi:MAG: Cna B-type domain-containing protein [Clostridia bacterium]|nr:Cna B-type domain-containing protein [Clostridia bacterium]
MHKIIFVQNSDGNGAGKRTAMYVANNSYLTLPDLYAGWQVEGKSFVGWSTDMEGDGNEADGVFVPDSQWMSSASSAVAVTDDKTFYAIWLDSTSTEVHDAYFHIKLDGEIPYEPYKSSEQTTYTDQHALSGTIRTTVSVNNNLDLVDANVITAPSMDSILAEVQEEGYYTDLTAEEFEAKYRVVWYVIKFNGQDWYHDSEDWHVDGVIVMKDSYMVQYNPNGGSGAPLSHSHAEAEKNIEIRFDTLPTREGYKFLGWSENPDAVEPTYTESNNIMAVMPAHDVTLYAVWTPDGDTPYSVEHYLEQADKTSYKIEETETLKGDTDSLVSAVPRTFEGYSVDYSIAETMAAGTIAADGSLVLKLYYTRDTGSLTLKKVYEGIESSKGVEFVLSGFDSKDYGRAVQGGSKTIGLDGTVSIVVPGNGEVTLTDIPTGTITVTEKGESGGKVTIDGKTFDVTGSGEEVTVTKGGSASKTITNTLSTKSVDVTKIWSDNSNAYGTRPAQITVHLMNGTTVAGTVTVAPVTDADSQTITFSGVSIYDASGNEITYTAAEEPVAGYETTIDGTTITNTLKTYSLNVAKQVSGNAAETTIPFDFSAVLLKGDGSAAPVNFTNAGSYTANGSNGVKFTLKHGESVKLEGIPYGYKVEVTETPFDLYVASNSYPKDGNGSVAMVGAFTYENAEATVTFTNTFNVSLPTGVDLDTIPYVVMLLSIFGAGALWLIGRRRRTQN